MITYLFPGQGSQRLGMGNALFDEFPDMTDKADNILGYSIKSLCQEGPVSKLNQTQYAQPALYTVGALMYAKKQKMLDSKPDFLIGHSLGEYCALYGSGVLDFETGLKLVKKRGEMMGKAAGGAMAAVLGVSVNHIKRIIQKNNLTRVEIANYNTPLQTVVSGAKEQIDRLSACLNGSGATYIPLNVSGAFHSSFMAPFQKEFEQYIRQFHFSPMEIPVISNVTALPYKETEIVKNLVDQIASPVRWVESIRYLIRMGEMNFEEIGEANLLIKMVKTIENSIEFLPPNENKKTINYNEDKTVTDRDLGALIPEQEPIASKSRTTTKENMGSKVWHVEFAGEMVAKEQKITASTLGNTGFKNQYNLKYAYLAGAMYRGISSKEMVVKMGKAGFMCSYGSGGVTLEDMEEAIRYIQMKLKQGQPYSFNLLHNPNDPEREKKKIDLLLKYRVKTIDAAGFIGLSLPLIKYRACGLARGPEGEIVKTNRIIGKVSRPEVAEVFLSPAPEKMIKQLLDQGEITSVQAELLQEIPVVDDLCVEADSGGHTDAGVAYCLMPAMIKLCESKMKRHKYQDKVHVGAAGGIGTPEAAAAAFILGADFILTGSINQCTVEANTSNAVKDMLQQMNVQDTDYAPSGDMFELGSKIQVLKRGVFFPSRAKKLSELYYRYNSLEEIGPKTRKQLQERYFKKSFDEIFESISRRLSNEQKEAIMRSPKQKMSLVFRWYFDYTSKLSLTGASGLEVEYQINCGPSLGAFNQWVKGTDLEDWRNRHVDEIGVKLMEETAFLLNERFDRLRNNYGMSENR